MALKARILYIDDSDVMLERVRNVLLADGYDVVTTSRTVGAAPLMQGCDLVIVDFHMPGFDGAAVLASLKGALGRSQAGSIPPPGRAANPMFYIYSSNESANHEFAKHGFDGCFTKKGDERALLPQVDAALRMRRLRALANRGH